ncbi:MAG: phosphatase PAP2 family protein [Acidobacteria bacterium]|nr:phosphatase PAP2 family protein [Acidobacteriota bacterium]
MGVATLPDAPNTAVDQLQSPFGDDQLSKGPKVQELRDPNELVPGEDPENRLMIPFLKHLANDQRVFWTAPMHLQMRDLAWITPVLGVVSGAVASDSWMAKQIPLREVETSKKFSNYAAYSLIGTGAASFLLGRTLGNDQMSEAGLLSGEASINSVAVAALFKTITRRPRPYQAHGSGRFFQGGSSFPSEHAALAWSVASVLAHEYPGPLTKILAYGLAAGVDATRVTGQQHFPSDVIVGSALGWWFGRQVYRAHHDSDLGGAAWGNLLPDGGGDRNSNPENMGSPYVPLDSWIYPALERLIALGYIKNAFLGIRPWTRIECARMLEDAEQQIDGDRDQPDRQATRIYEDLARELSEETARLNGSPNLGANLDSVYTRTTNISGSALRDGYHFAQTITDDYGRPYGGGFNAIAGITAHAVAGPISISFRGEYQHAPAIGSSPLSVLDQIAAADHDLPVSNAYAGANRLRLLDSTVAVTFHNIQVSFGKQSQWLGPGESGALLFSNNAEPMPMVKIDSVSPYEIPLLSRLLGPARSEYFIGQLSGDEFEFNGHTGQLVGPGNVNPQPFLQGVKIGFKPTSNFEFGLGATAQFAGPGLPFTWHNFLRTFYSHVPGGDNPGKRLSSADFSYRVPGLRNWLTVYSDTLVVDEYSPIGSTRATVNPGFYVPQIPKLHNLSLRAEGVREPLTNEFVPGFVYYGIRRFLAGYTNNGTLLGSWIGRAGRGGQGWLTYSFSARSNLQFGYRLQEVSKDFIAGGRLADYFCKTNLKLGANVDAAGAIQYEQWRFPVLASNQQSNLSASFQLTFYPHFAKKN